MLTSTKYFPIIDNTDTLPSWQWKFAIDLDCTVVDTYTAMVGWLLKLSNPEWLTEETYRRKYPEPYDRPPYHKTDDTEAMLNRLFYDNDWQKTLPPMENASNILGQISNYVWLYLSARPSCVAQWSREWLIRNNFPPAPIIFRPERIKLPDATQWKTQILMKLWMGIIDDHPNLWTALEEAGFKGVHIRIWEISSHAHRYNIAHWDELLSKYWYLFRP